MPEAGGLRPVTLLPDRALDTSRSWLAQHQSISIVARDRAGGYDEAIAKALPGAGQVAGRWHLMDNSSRAFLDAVGKIHAPDQAGDRLLKHVSPLSSECIFPRLPALTVTLSGFIRVLRLQAGIVVTPA